MKNFIFEDFEKKYENCVFKRVPGKSPELIFFSKNGQELERLDISKMKRDELNELVVAKGIALKQSKTVHDEP